MAAGAVAAAMSGRAKLRAPEPVEPGPIPALFAPDVIAEARVAAGLCAEHPDDTLILVSDAFDGQSRLARQRRVIEVLGPEVMGAIHSITMKTLTPQEFADAGGASNPAPACRGGGH